MNIPCFQPPIIISKTNFVALTEDHRENEVTLPWKIGTALFSSFLVNWLETNTDATDTIEEKFAWACDGHEVYQPFLIEAFDALLNQHPSGIPIFMNCPDEHPIDPSIIFNQTIMAYVTQISEDLTDDRVFVAPELFKLLDAMTAENVLFFPRSSSLPAKNNEVEMSKRFAVEDCCLCLEGDILYFGLLQYTAHRSGYDARLGVFINKDRSLRAMNVLESLEAVRSFPANSENNVAKLLRAYIAGVMRNAEMNELGAYDVVLPIESTEHNRQHSFLMSVVL